MKPLLLLYPRTTRDRYGDEISLLLEESPHPVRDGLNVVWHALLDRTDSVMHLTWRRLPRFLLASFAAIAASYAVVFVTYRFDAGPRTALSHVAAVLFTVASAIAAGALAGYRTAVSPRVLLIAPAVAAAQILAVLIEVTITAGRFPFDGARILRALGTPFGVWAGLILLVGFGLLRWSSGRRRWWLVLGGGWAILQAITMLRLAVTVPVVMPDAGAAAWYWRGLAGLPIPYGPGTEIVNDPGPWQFTVLTAFALAFLLTATRRAPAPATAAVVPAT
jgi:hypothetical protein